MTVLLRSTAADSVPLSSLSYGVNDERRGLNPESAGAGSVGDDVGEDEAPAAESTPVGGGGGGGRDPVILRDSR